jgi:hypothetical protein
MVFNGCTGAISAVIVLFLLSYSGMKRGVYGAKEQANSGGYSPLYAPYIYATARYT